MTTFRSFSILMMILGSLILSTVASAGEIAVELADSIASMPSGEYVDDLDEANIECKAPKASIKYTFEFGLILGREELTGCSYVKEAATDDSDSPQSQYLFVRSRNIIVGLAFGTEFRFSLEAGLPEQGRVYLSDSIVEGVRETSNQSQSINSQWIGFTFDWGFMSSDGQGLGLIASIRQLDASTNNLFGTNKDFQAHASHFNMGLRYRY